MSAMFARLSDTAQHCLREQQQPAWITPTLATLVHEPFSDPDWIYEPKFDGERCLVFKHGDDVRIMSRNRKRLDETYPDLVDAFSEQAGDDFVVDGEIVALDRGITSFARLQERMQIPDTDRARASAVAVYCYLFDVLHVDGHDVTSLPLHDRKKLLSRAVHFRDPVRETPYRTEDGENYYREACRAGWEGALAKNGTSAYIHGRSRRWLKFKCVATQELVIGGFTEPTGSRHDFGALLVGYYEDHRLVYAGKVGTGFTEDTLSDLGARLAAREQERPPFTDEVRERHAHWVKPELVAQIEFTEWTGDGKLRHPSYLGLRRDKDPADITRERAS